ncbi:O-antigen ligase family protein [Paenibacillus sp. P96]|uniref:O-antigen ligase family protein n=1 Tax=Paenibacillus zeirhizosphaerae TaxID=2987519 RepID=A0ABT9FPQ9_9BACL|nr:O-antigen ligase family protein [Paenibacillus sp. P96]MDP4096506.1 O-antigen ligase family protein [Paenibacillus sp. P96]
MSNPVYGKQAHTSTRDEKRSPLFWVLIVGIMLFFVWSPFQAALFNGQMLDFEKPIYWALTITSILLILVILSYYKKFKLEEQRDWLAVLVILLPVTYALSLISAASHYLAMNMVIVQCVYASMFITSLYLLQDRLGNKMIQIIIMTVAYLIVGFGFINWFGQWILAGKLVDWFSSAVYQNRYTSAVMTDSNGLRLTSVFQYANTYAAFLMAFLFASIFSLMKSKTWFGRLTHGFMLVPILVSLFLTLSRGGLVMLPVVFVILLLFFKSARQLLWIIYCVVAGIVSLAVLSPITNMGLELNQTYNGATAAKGWGLLIAAAAISGVISWLIQQYVAPKLENGMQGWASRKLSNLWLPVGSVVIVGVVAFLLIGTSLRNVLPENIRVRVEGINFQQHSVLERFQFYEDASKLIADYPIIGAGGGGWATLYEKYQDYPYTSRQAHNFFMQYLVEVGILGFIIFMAFILFVFYKYTRGYIQQNAEERDSYFLYFILTLSILLHSILDFNLSYVFMGMLVFVGLGGMAAAMDSRPVKRLTLNPGAFRPLYSGVIGIVAIVLVFTGLRFIQSSNAATEARQVARTSQSFDQIQVAVNEDLSIRPTHPDSLLLLSSLYQAAYKQSQNEQFYTADEELLQRGLEAEPYNKSMYSYLMSHYQLKNGNEKAFEILQSKISNYKWDISWYSNLIQQAFTLGIQAREQGDIAKQQQYFEAGLNAYQQVLDGIAHINDLPDSIILTRQFNLTPEIALNTGKIQFMSNKFAEAVVILQPLLNEDLSNATNKEIARYYVAATQKQGQVDHIWYDKLIQADANEKQQIDDLVALKLQ